MRRITAVRDSSYSSSALLDSLTGAKKYCRSCLGPSRQKALLRTLSFVVSVLPSSDGLGTLSHSLFFSLSFALHLLPQLECGGTAPCDTARQLHLHQ